jgi:hypothetical protein
MVMRIDSIHLCRLNEVRAFSVGTAAPEEDIILK